MSGRARPLSGPDTAETLRAYGRIAQDALLALIPDDPANSWLYDIVREYPRRPGKYIRAALCMGACRAFGGGVDEALLPAVSIEMLHNAFLIHDDVADGSERRRGEPTLHSMYGIGLAVNAGDALAILAQRTLRQAMDLYPAGLANRLLVEFETMMQRTAEGQARELGWCRDPSTDVTPDDYLELIMLKTCWYTTIHPLRAGALVGSRGEADVTEMVRFGFYLGAAFQIRDDVLNLTGDEERYGKEILGDLFEGKRTLMLIHLIGRASGADRGLVQRYLECERSDRSRDLVEDVRALMDKYGSLDFAEAYAEGIAAAAEDAFASAFAGAERNEGCDFVGSMIPFMLERTV